MDSLFVTIGDSQNVLVVLAMICLTISLFLICILMVSRMVKNNRKPENYSDVKAMVEELLPDAKEEKLNINKISKAISIETNPDKAEVNSFEQEQEEKAIISYEELVKAASAKNEINDEVVAVELPSTKQEKFEMPSIEKPKPITVKTTNLDSAKSYLEDLKGFRKKLR